MVSIHAVRASVVVVLLLAGCNGSSTSAPTASPAAPAAPATAAPLPPVAVLPPPPDRHREEIATGNGLTRFQRERLLGHYSTEDGRSGFILDRTVSPWKARLDGSNDVLTLSEKRPGAYHSTEYLSEPHKLWIRVGEDGEVQLMQGPTQHEGVNVVRDAGANPLP
jgi:hypothetical protein